MMIVLRDMFQVGGHFGGGQEESAIATTESARASMVPLTTIALTACRMLQDDGTTTKFSTLLTIYMQLY